MRSLVDALPSQLQLVPYAGDRAGWDAFVSAHPESTFCHHSAWHDLLHDTFGVDCRYRAVFDESGRYHGVLPLVRMKGLLRSQHLISLPFLNYGGPLGSPNARALLAQSAVEEARSSRADSLELRDRFTGAPAAGLAPGRSKITVLLDLPETAEQLSERLGSKLRSQIRRPQKDGMVTRFGPAEQTAFYDVFSRNMRDLGTPVLPRDLFTRLNSTFGDQVVFGVVYSGATPVAAGCGFVWRAEFEMTWASALREFNRSAPNMLLYWSFMEAMIARGVKVFNFGRCTPNGGTHRFKKQWQSKDAPLPWTELRAGGLAAEDGTPSAAMRAASAAWQRLPLPIANRIGPLLARRLSNF